MSDQLPLPFEPAPTYEAADFIDAPCNEAARAWLDRTADWPERRLALWGDLGCGKTHLLRIWAARLGAKVLAGAALDALPDLPRTPLAIDDADRAPELALLRALNTAAEAGQAVLLAAGVAPGRWRVGLPDLASRLRAVTAVEIGPPDDELLGLLLQRLIQQRQMLVDRPVREQMLRDLPRRPGALRLAVARLDQAALARGGKVTRALAAAVIAPLIGSDDDRMTDPSRASPAPLPFV